jgi:hypothetical protein
VNYGTQRRLTGNRADPRKGPPRRKEFALVEPVLMEQGCRIENACVSGRGGASASALSANDPLAQGLPSKERPAAAPRPPVIGLTIPAGVLKKTYRTSYFSQGIMQKAGHHARKGAPRTGGQASGRIAGGSRECREDGTSGGGKLFHKIGKIFPQIAPGLPSRPSGTGQCGGERRHPWGTPGRGRPPTPEAACEEKTGTAQCLFRGRRAA